MTTLKTTSPIIASNNLRDCKKKTEIVYELRHDAFESLDDLLSFLATNKQKIVLYTSFMKTLPSNFLFTTKFPDGEVEQTFCLDSSHPNLALIVGTCGEVYFNKNYLAKFVEVGKDLFGCMPESRKCMQVDYALADYLDGSLMTSYGSVVRCICGDYLILDGDGFYRVKESVFVTTYDVV